MPGDFGRRLGFGCHGRTRAEEAREMGRKGTTRICYDASTMQTLIFLSMRRVFQGTLIRTRLMHTMI